MENTKSGMTRWFMLMLMLAAFIATFVTRFMWSPMQSEMMTVLGIDAATAGAVFSIFFTGYIITQIPAGVLADKFGVKIIMSISLIISGLASYGMTLITSVNQAFILRIIIGLGAGTIYACCARVISNYFEPEKRSMAFGIVLAGPNAGYFIASFFGPKILLSSGWEGGFKFAAAFSIIIAILIIIFVKGDKPEKGNQSVIDVIRGFKILLTNRGVLLISLSGFGLMWFQLALYNWAFGYTRSLGFTDNISTVGILIAIGGIISTVISGTLVDKFKIDRRKFLMFGYGITGIMVILFGMQKELIPLLVSSFILGLISYSTNSHLSALIVDYAGGKMAATATGVSNFVFQFASQISPAVVGTMLVATGGVFSISIWLVMATGPFLGVLCALMAAGTEKAVEVED